MTQEQLIQQIMMSAFADELEKISMRTIARRAGETAAQALQRMKAERMGRSTRTYSRSAQFGTAAERKASREATSARGHGPIDATPGYATGRERISYGGSIA